ncbi:MAG: arsenate reductase ArsC [Pseudomonadota bacterium]
MSADISNTLSKKPPGSVLFTCNLNSVRSPMAEALTKHLYGKRFYVDSAGLEPTERDPFVVSVMEEAGIDMTKDRPLAIDAVDIGSFDLVISLTPESCARVTELARAQAVEIEFWPTLDPFAAGEGGTREQRLTAYRRLRDDLRAMIVARFGPCDAAT